MARYPALSLRPVIVVYNLFCAALNLYIGLEIFLTSLTINYSWTCQPVDYSTNPAAVRIARALWLYYVSKLIELAGQITFSVGSQTIFSKVTTSFSRVTNHFQ